ncbi:MAG: DUF1295 domain-containing protein [Anaerolineae bacterium]|nr:DUF1295 domain-containing protein [Anaerolineae bacterium]
MFWLPLLAILLYGILHSFLAASNAKGWVREQIGARRYEGFYRLFYNVISAILFVPVILAVVATPARIVWRVPMPWAAIMLGVQLVGLVALIAAVLQADPLRFAGLKQALAYLRGDPLPLPPEPLQQNGFYGFVRHPLYLFSMLVLWPTPVMTDTFLAFTLGATAYFIAGSLLEERRLMAEFGSTYRHYRRQVP